jgi:hypothetical protein
MDQESKNRRSAVLFLRFWVCALGGIRTPNLLIRSQMLYPLSYERTLQGSAQRAESIVARGSIGDEIGHYGPVTPVLDRSNMPCGRVPVHSLHPGPGSRSEA